MTLHFALHFTFCNFRDFPRKRKRSLKIIADPQLESAASSSSLRHLAFFFFFFFGSFSHISMLRVGVVLSLCCCCYCYCLVLTHANVLFMLSTFCSTPPTTHHPPPTSNPCQPTTFCGRMSSTLLSVFCTCCILSLSLSLSLILHNSLAMHLQLFLLHPLCGSLANVALNIS